MIEKVENLTAEPMRCSFPQVLSITNVVSGEMGEFGVADGVTAANVTTQPLGSIVTGVPIVHVGEDGGATTDGGKVPIGMLVLVIGERVSIGSLILIPEERVPIASLIHTSPAIEDGEATGVLPVCPGGGGDKSIVVSVPIGVFVAVEKEERLPIGTLVRVIRESVPIGSLIHI
jgi:hypothetical protein